MGFSTASPQDNGPTGFPLGVDRVSSAPCSTNYYSDTTSLTSSCPRIPPEGHHLSSASSTVLSFPYLHGAEERRRQSQNNHRSLPTQHPHHSTAYNIRQPHQSCTNNDSTSRHGLPRHQGGIHPHPHPPESTQISGVFHQQSTVLLSCPPIRPLLSPIHIHQNSLLAHSTPAQPRHLHSSIFRRHPPLAPFGNRPQPTPGHFNMSFATARFHNSSSQVLSDSPTNHAVARDTLARPNRPLVCSPRLSTSNHESSPINCNTTLRLQTVLGGSSRQTQFCLPGASTPAHTPPAVVQSTTTRSSSSTRLCSTTARQSSRCSSLLDVNSSVDPHSALSIFGSFKIPVDRRVHRRVGSLFRQQRLLPRSVESSRWTSSHKRPGASCGPVRYKTVQPLRLSPRFAHRQRGGTLCYSEVTRQVTDSPRRVLCAEPPLPQPSTAPIRHADTHPLKRDCRRTESPPPARHGVAASTTQLFRSGQLARSHGGGPLLDSTQCTTANICDALPPPQSGGDRCLSVGLGQISGDLPVSPSQPHPSGAAETSSLQGQGDFSGALGSVGHMVPCPSANGLRPPSPANDSISTLSGGEDSTLIEAVQEMDRLQFLKMILLKKSSENVVNTMLASYRQSSNNQHEVAWKAWKNWLPPIVNVITLQTMLEFFHYLFEVRKLAPNTIMNYRNSLAWPLKEAFGVDLHLDEVSKLMKGFFHLRPPTPTSVPEWDLGKVIQFYENLAEPLNNRHLFFKTLILVALATGNRCSELSAFSRDGLIFNASGVTIPLRPHFLYKNQTLRRTPPPIQIPSFNYPLLCPVTFLKRYLASCAPSDNSRALFVHPQSFASLSAGRIGYWLIQTIRLAHTDCPIVKPHDVRKLAYSANWARKTDLQSIVQHGFWASAHPFINNYLVSLPSPLPHFVAAGSSV